MGRFMPGGICGRDFDLIWSMFSEAFSETFREPNQRGHSSEQTHKLSTDSCSGQARTVTHIKPTEGGRIK